MKSGSPSCPAGRGARLALGLLTLAGTAWAMEAPAGSMPADILHRLRQFQVTGSVLQIAAHPDDENTELNAWLSRGRGLRTAYLSITRGDGGQNVLGPEIGDELGVIRTEELLAARRIDGARQFFTRAVDFGYSKTPEETLRIWNHQEVLADVVRVIREFRPDVIITRFPIPPGSGGHGHHTASAILAVEAFKLAGDPKAFPDQIREGLAPWQPRRIMWNIFRFGNAALALHGPTIEEDIGGVDPVTGEELGTLANRSRGMHRTQGLGFLANRPGGGPRPESFMLLGGDAPTRDIMDGIDTTWGREPGADEIGPMADAIIGHFQPDDPAASVPALLDLRRRLDGLKPDPLVAEKRRQLDRILQECLGLAVDTTLPQAEVVPGEALRLDLAVTIAAKVPARWVAVRYPALRTEVDTGVALTAGQKVERHVAPVLPTGTPPSQPYWLREEGTPGMFRVDDPSLIGRPENPPVFPVEYVFEIDGQKLVVSDQPVQLVPEAPPAQKRRRLAVIPPVSLGFGADVRLFAPDGDKPVAVDVTAARDGAAGTLRLAAPAGWRIVPDAQSFHLAHAGDKVRLDFEVTAPDHPASAEISATAEVGGARCDTERKVISYEHLPVILLQPPARFKAVSLHLAVHARRVGYLPGAGDSVADALTQMGCEVTQLTGADLTPDRLRGLDAVVIGVRAFNVRTDLADHLPGLFAYIEAGGTVVEQYNRPGRDLKTTQLGPYPLSIEGPAPRLRVTNEDAPVTFLAPDHPVLNVPNKITEADFAGWVQERGTYFPSSWDEAHYTAILAMSDPGEAPLKSSLLVARYGKGWFVYTGLVFFRQLPAGVPGAYRLFANLVSLGK